MGTTNGLLCCWPHAADVQTETTIRSCDICVVYFTYNIEDNHVQNDTKHLQKMAIVN